MTALGFMRYHVYGDKESDIELWPKMTTTFEEADGPDMGVPADADDFTMDRRSIMALAKAKAKEEMAAKEAAKMATAGGAQPSSDAAKKPPMQPKKKRHADDGQKKLTEAGMQSKKPRRASPLTDTSASGMTVPDDDAGGSNAIAVVDAVSVPSSTALTQPPSVGQEPRKQRAGKKLAGGTYKLEIEYPVKGGVFNDAVDGHDVLAQVVPVEDRAYLKKLGPVKIYDSGMDLIIQGALMLMESHKRQEQEIARLREAEKKAASAEEAMGCLDRLREEVKALQKGVDEVDVAYRQVAADRDDALRVSDEALRSRDEALLRVEDAARAQADSERAAEKAVDGAIERFLAEGWKADDRRP
ncbi:unnamed protein product [Cuscuta europaea]|uniref:Uncharacterized protein n=1 Tax=Cuscuta europaea TaxID=41803 RepID=A0A9P0Z7E0_CUSEU|nr:unnamed protein product [Cuscuta europaea]